MYSPKIKEKYIPVLYQLSKALDQPMTKLVNQAVKDLIAKHKGKLLSQEVEMKETVH